MSDKLDNMIQLKIYSFEKYEKKIQGQDVIFDMCIENREKNKQGKVKQKIENFMSDKLCSMIKLKS